MFTQTFLQDPQGLFARMQSAEGAALENMTVQVDVLKQHLDILSRQRSQNLGRITGLEVCFLAPS